jgi:selenide,water dikinase
MEAPRDERATVVADEDASMNRDREVVLVGAGHAHVEVLRAWSRDPEPRARLTLVVDRETALYSGMVPGFVAGQYRAGDLEIALRPLARRARARIVLGEAIRIDTDASVVHVKGEASVVYDVASLDVGSTVAGKDLPGVREHAIPTRPIADLVERIDAVLRQTTHEHSEHRLIVVGAGAGGVELAFCFEARLRRETGKHCRLLLLDAGPSLLAEASPRLRARVERAARRRRIDWRCGARVAGVEATSVRLDSGEALPTDAVIWVTGAAALPFLRSSGLPVNADGFVRVQPTFQVEGRRELFAVGDCASLCDGTRVPKAGVYAVRAGPVLTRNLRSWLRGEPLTEYRPQRDFLSLLNLGDGTAIGGKWGLAFEGRSVLLLKDWIDRRFVRRYA